MHSGTVANKHNVPAWPGDKQTAKRTQSMTCAAYSCLLHTCASSVRCTAAGLQSTKATVRPGAFLGARWCRREPRDPAGQLCDVKQ